MEVVEEEGLVRRVLRDPNLWLDDSWVRSECDTNLLSDCGLSLTLSSSSVFPPSLK